jgi:hypothetical protein
VAAHRESARKLPASSTMRRDEQLMIPWRPPRGHDSRNSGNAGNTKLTATPECAESKECHAPKHHYDECVERVTGQIENDGKASEDCVEECTPFDPSPRHTTY